MPLSPFCFPCSSLFPRQSGKTRNTEYWIRTIGHIYQAISKKRHSCHKWQNLWPSSALQQISSALNRQFQKKSHFEFIWTLRISSSTPVEFCSWWFSLDWGTRTPSKYAVSLSLQLSIISALSLDIFFPSLSILRTHWLWKKRWCFSPYFSQKFLVYSIYSDTFL